MLMRMYKDDSLQPMWEGSETVLLMTLTTLKVTTYMQWVHFLRVKQVPTDTPETVLKPRCKDKSDIWEAEPLDGLKFLFKKQKP